MPTARLPMPMLAPQVADQVSLSAPERQVHRLTIDVFLQRHLEDLARERARSLGPGISVGIVAIDKFNGSDTPALIWDAIEAKVAR